MKKIALLFVVAAGMVVWLVGCDSEEGNLHPNQPPTTVLTVAPNDSAVVNHYIPLGWAGNDPDGKVEGFWLLVDGDTLTYTIARDTILSFTAASDGTPSPHTFEVIAVDNEGLSDTTGANALQARQRFFYTTNTAPVLSFLYPGTITDGAVVGKGFRVTLDANDANFSITYYSISIDDSISGWSEWFTDSIFIFADPVVLADTAVLPRRAVFLSSLQLAVGSHRLFARAKDAGDALSNQVSLSFSVQENFRPTMNPTVTGQYAGANLYPDGSAYYQILAGTETQIAFSGSAEGYGGEINAYRFRINEGAWSPWQSEAALDTADLRHGEFVFQIQARDWAGAISDPLSYVVRLVTQALTDSIIVVDETFDGNGNPGSPTDGAVDSFYTDVLAGYKVRAIDYVDTARGPTHYISPFDIGNAGLIIWHDDDRGDRLWNENFTIIRAFLSRGGRLILSGWDVMKGFEDVDTLAFAAGSFPRDEMRIFNAYRNRSRHVTGFEGVAGFAGCSIDSTKLPPNWRGLIDKCWIFRPRGECTVIASLNVDDAATNPFAGGHAAYLYDLSYRIAVYGVPLFFCWPDQVYTLFHGDANHTGLVSHMLQGLE